MYSATIVTTNYHIASGRRTEQQLCRTTYDICKVTRLHLFLTTATKDAFVSIHGYCSQTTETVHYCSRVCKSSSASQLVFVFFFLSMAVFVNLASASVHLSNSRFLLFACKCRPRFECTSPQPQRSEASYLRATSNLTLVYPFYREDCILQLRDDFKKCVMHTRSLFCIQYNLGCSKSLIGFEAISINNTLIIIHFIYTLHIQKHKLCSVVLTTLKHYKK